MRVMAERVPLHLYLVTDRHQTHGRPLLEVVEAGLRGGVDAVQLREKDLPTDELTSLALVLVRLCRRYGARLLINDRIDVALAVGADGVHLPVNSFAIADARYLLGDRLIAASTHHPHEAYAAAQAGADFLVFGPVFDTPTKRTFGAPRGLAQLAEVTIGVEIPVLAIGGVTADTAATVRDCGAAGIAVVAAILRAADPRVAAARLRTQLGVPLTSR